MKIVTTISTNVTEEIHSKKLFTFLKTQIELKDTFITSESIFYYSYLPKVKRYEIILFSQKNEAYQFAPFYFSQLNDNSENPILYISKTFFCIYEKKKLQVFKEVLNISQEDIKSYIAQTYHIEDLKVIHLEENKIKELVNSNDKKYQTSIDKNTYQVDPSNSLRYFLYYSITIFTVFVFFLYNSYEKGTTQKCIANNINLQKNLQDQTLLLYKKHQKNHTIKTFLNFNKELQKDKIIFQKLEFNKGRFRVQLIGNDKQKLLQVLQYPLEQVSLKSIRYDQTHKLYSMEVEFYGK